jgi:glycosyltransferase involved in cell wall biosynthesis
MVFCDDPSIKHVLEYKSGQYYKCAQPPDADWCVEFLKVEKSKHDTLKRNARTLLRTNGIYCSEYNAKFNRVVNQSIQDFHLRLKKSIEASDWVVYQSEWSRQQIRAEIVKRDDNWSIIHNGTDTNLFVPNHQDHDEYLNLLYVGQIRDAYIADTLLGIYSELKSRNVKCRLVLAGDQDEACKSRFRSNAGPDLYCLGRTPNDKLPAVYALGDVFLSVRQGCSCSNVVSEAQSCALPIISPLWSGDAELIKDRETGIIVPTGHWTYDADYVRGLADAVVEVSRDLDGYRQRSRQHALKELSLDLMVDKYLKAMGI